MCAVSAGAACPISHADVPFLASLHLILSEQSRDPRTMQVGSNLFVGVVYLDFYMRPAVYFDTFSSCNHVYNESKQLLDG